MQTENWFRYLPWFELFCFTLIQNTYISLLYTWESRWNSRTDTGRLKGQNTTVFCLVSIYFWKELIDCILLILNRQWSWNYFQIWMILFIHSVLVWQLHVPIILEVLNTQLSIIINIFIAVGCSSAVSVLMLLFMIFPDYMVEKLGIDRSNILELSNLLYKNYGTTMAGLRVWFKDISCYTYDWNLLMYLFFFPYNKSFKFVNALQAIGYNFDYDDYHR